MLEVAILALDNTPLSSLSLPADILNAAGVLWNKIAGIPEKPLFRVSIVTPGGKPVTCYKTIGIKPNGALEKLTAPDFVLIGALAGLDGVGQRYREQIQHLRRLHDNGAVLGSICTGAFILAETGLLDGRRATTHWGMSQLFAQLYPQVHVDTSRTVVDEGTILTSGGTTAGSDLSLYIIRKWFGSEVADQAARVLLLDPYRLYQAPYEAFHNRIAHEDDEILNGQQWMDTNYHKEISVEVLAEQCNMSRRTFERRFKKATGDSPLRYLQRIRIEKAKQLLEQGNQTFETITAEVGYEDTSSFRRMFQKVTGVPPSIYREKFRRDQSVPGSS